MRVLFTTNIPSPYRVDFFNELGKYCDLTVLFESQTDKSRDANWLADKVTKFNAVFMKGIKKGSADAFCPEVLKYLSLKKYDVIVIGAYHTPTGMMAIQYLKMRNIPFILSSDGGMKKTEHRINYRIKKYFISSASAWLSTGAITNEYLEYYGAKKEKIYVYPFTSIKKAMILEKPLSTEEKLKIRRELGMLEDKIVLSVGQFIHRKGYDVLLEACKDLDNNIGIYIVGGQPTEEYIRLKHEFELTNVHFIDFMKPPQLAKYYQASDLFVLPTREDIWGLVINEAMSQGLPIITTSKCVAGMEMINGEENGLIIPINDVDQLQTGMVKLLNSVNYDQRCINNLNTSHEYTIEKMAVRHIEVFMKIRKIA
ncbi:hypothetical protein PCCS19_42230 [Paenibacillus sp. CCS19]|uniref:glycosyltransferase family 4 protein n=1 Tax=Paenibacillus sp. CCS19 TaxID=3158387 RepID=UPI00256E76A7|nr:glycosyltransferase family 4 protein [Paenibacillus cellulosilyticus]GMK41167.1 hypothetical protein PCCS19_42230 [Paenibacillus cellulosilyticus]